MTIIRRLLVKIMSRLNRVMGLTRVEVALEEILINQGRILSRLNSPKTSRSLKEYEFKVFSQAGEDGIIQKLVSSVEIKNATFIEFGVGDFRESNCRFLLTNNNWRGFVIDGSQRNISRLKASYYYWRYQIEATASFITRESINELLQKSRFDPDLGILSIDIDGVDYWIWEAIEFFRPRIVIVEYNAVFGDKRKISVPYAQDFQRTRAHFSNLYFGASLPAISYLARKKGYALVGTNSLGVNAFFVRNDLLNNKLKSMSAREAYTASLARESLDQDGRPSYLGGEERLSVIRGLPVINVETGIAETL